MLIILTACGSSGNIGTPSPVRLGKAAHSPSPAPSPSLQAIELPKLPEQGIAMQLWGRRVELFDLAGHRLFTFKGFWLARHPWAPSRPLFLERGYTLYRLDVTRRLLVPIPPPRPKTAPIGTAPPIFMTGSWPYVGFNWERRSPTQPHVRLIQADTCDGVLLAFLATPGEPLALVTGQVLPVGLNGCAAVPGSSAAVGWTKDGRALAFLGGPAGLAEPGASYSYQGPTPRVYAFREPGDGQLLFAVPRRLGEFAIRMWGGAGRA